jgi:queuosine precursor transporter
MSAQAEVQDRGFRYFSPLAMIFVSTLLISNIAAQKLFAFGPFTFSCGILLFPVSYIAGDTLTEVYGFSKTRLVIWTGLICNLILIATIQISIWLPPAQGWPLQEQFAATLGLVPRVVLASVLGYWAGEFVNSYVLAKMKVLTKGRHLWMRTVGSTVVGQAVDTIIFVVVAFYNIFPTGLLISAIFSGYLFKVLYEAIATPFTYAVVSFLKKREGIDVYDRNTDFNPFNIQT